MLDRRHSTYISYAIMFISAALMTVIGPMLAELAGEFNLTLSQSGLMYTAEFTGFTLFIILGGVLSDKLGKRHVLTVILIVLAISLYAFSVSNSFYASLAIMFFAGGFCGPLESITLSIISDLNPMEMEKYINTGSVFYGLGAMAGPAVAGICLTYDVSWRTVYLGLSITCLVLLFVSFLASIPKTKKSGNISMNALKKIIKDWRFMLVCLCVFLYCGAESCAWGWMSEYMDTNLGFSVLKSSLAIGVFWLSITVGRLINIRIGERVSTRVLVGVLAIGAAVVTFVSAYVASEAFAWISTVLMGLFYSSIWPLMVGQAGKRHAQHSGTSFALVVSTGGISMAIIPALMGVVAQNFGVFISQILPAFFFAILFFLYVFIARPEKN